MGIWDTITRGFSKAVDTVVNGTVGAANTVANTTVDVANTVADTAVNVGNTIADTTVGWYNDSQQIIICTESIANCAMDVQGHDPRKWMTSCATDTLFKGEGPEYFKQCLITKMQTEVKDLSDPVGYANKLYDTIKEGCS